MIKDLSVNPNGSGLRYENCPVLTLTNNAGKEFYLTPFRGYRFQVSKTYSGQGYVASAVTNTEMYKLAHLDMLGHDMLKLMAIESCKKAGLYFDNNDIPSLNRFIEMSMKFLIKNEEHIKEDNPVYTFYTE